MAHPTPKLRRFAIALQFQPFAVQSGLKYSLVFLTGPTTTIVSADPKEKLQRRSYHPIQKKSRSRRPRLTNLILAPHVSPRIRARRELGLNLLRKLVRVLFLPLLRARSGNIWLSRVSGTARRGRREPAFSFSFLRCPCMDAPLRRALSRRVTAVGRADKQHDDERRDHYGLAQAACGVAGAVVVRRLGSRRGAASGEPGAGGRRAGRRNYS